MQNDLTALVSNLIVPELKQRSMALKQRAMLFVWVEKLENLVVLPA
jgi:hypothetical protein